jgi:hypothetical protein
MKLGTLVLDRTLLDAHGKRAGKVDDLLLDLPADGGAPVVLAIVTGPLALTQHAPRPLRALVRLLYRLLGVSDPQPVVLPWRHVTTIDVAVHVALEREAAGLDALARAVARRYIDRMPGG